MKKKFNIVDIIIIAVIVAIIAMITQRGKIKESISGDKKRVRFTCLVEELPKETFEDLKVGDELFAQYAIQPGKITKIETFSNNRQDFSEGITDEIYNPDNLSAKVTCEAEVLYDGPYMQLGGQEVKAGIDYILKTETFAANSKIVFAEVIE